MAQLNAASSRAGSVVMATRVHGLAEGATTRLAAALAANRHSSRRGWQPRGSAAAADARAAAGLAARAAHASAAINAAGFAASSGSGSRKDGAVTASGAARRRRP